MKPLDFVKTKGGSIAIITETSDGEAVIAFIWRNPDDYKNSVVAWYSEDDLEILGNLPHLLASKMAHPFGNGQEDADKAFKEV
jgi:hypothetical protein